MGVVTYKKADLGDVVSYMDLEHMVLETDSPYLSPVPYRGKRNESAYIPIIAQKVAEMRGSTVAEIKNSTTENAKILFGF